MKTIKKVYEAICAKNVSIITPTFSSVKNPFTKSEQKDTKESKKILKNRNIEEMETV